MLDAANVHVATACGGGYVGRFLAMASPCEVLCCDAGAEETEALTRVAATEVLRIEQHWSRYRNDNVVYRINTAGGAAVQVDEETARFLDYAQHLYQFSDGLFDVTSGVLRRVWPFDGSDRVPTQAAIDAVLPLVGWHRVRWRSPELQMPPGMEIDFGGIGKEYAVDRALKCLREQTSKPVLVNCGGDLAVSGPRSDGSQWQVGIDLQQPGSPAPTVGLSSGAIASSGDAHRFLLKGGIRYPHVLDPRSGWAVVGGPRTVTVRAASCTEAGVLSTLALLHGANAESFLREQLADAAVWW
ncbi:FAD:protein FMN transferase [Sinimarinibacterium sp. CAU 1509]|uniref:FAD:protein FMN transferase n=1 Tax=Sinimarinibacterium sp. CAU 1509 TaxID=2562283 RepID=UPI0010ABF7AF|nr:FAD:protein FMN transferase [Sinimarinibacterium sp. CAU 1509]TJY63137.1 FAD:protein FMN transferase [Sinimarinibacterium sp. CAU 1509]